MGEANRVDTDRAVGALLGAAVGDALGWPQEVRGGLVGGQRARDQLEPKPELINWTRNAGHYRRRYPDPVRAGEYSDDTQLLLVVARACLAGEGWYEHLTTVELPAWPLYQRGGGGAVLSAAGSWADRVPPWSDDGTAARARVTDRYARAGANGVAMRIAPHVVVASTAEELHHRVLQDGLTTHGHPRALVGALVYASALRAALQVGQPLGYGELLEAARSGLISGDEATTALPPNWRGTRSGLGAFLRTWEETNQEARDLLALAESSIRRGAMSNAEGTLAELGCTDPKINGAGTVSGVAACYLASRYAARPLSGLVSGAFLRRGDTDTLASMTGALLGAVHGSLWLGELARQVQDAEYVAKVARALLGEPSPGIAQGRPGPSQVRRAEWKDAIRASRQGDRGTFADGRKYEVLDVQTLPSSTVSRVRMRFADGQTALHDFADPSKPATASSSNRASEGERTAADRGRVGESSREMWPESGAELVAVTALTNDLRSCVAFYARLLGADIVVRGGEAEITPWFRLREVSSAIHEPAVSTVALVVRVADPVGLARRFGSTSVEEAPGLPRLRDPDGRLVQLERH